MEINMDALSELLLNFAFNFAVVFTIIRFIYYPQTRNKDYVFTFFAFNTIIFFVLRLLSSINLSIGLGFGLFAIFSVLRYRTNPIPIREMTYIFIVIALPVMNSILLSENGFTPLLIANLLILVVLFIVEQGWGFKFLAHQTILYEKIELIKPENRNLLMEDLRQRTGHGITRIEIGSVDFLRDTAKIEIFYEERN